MVSASKPSPELSVRLKSQRGITGSVQNGHGSLRGRNIRRFLPSLLEPGRERGTYGGAKRINGTKELPGRLSWVVDTRSR
jgi:hypothetical protein